MPLPGQQLTTTLASFPAITATTSPLSSDQLTGRGGGADKGMVLLAVLLCTLLRGSKLQESKVRGIEACMCWLTGQCCL